MIIICAVLIFYLATIHMLLADRLELKLFTF